MNIFVAIPEGDIRDSFLSSENVAFLETLGRLTWNESEKNLTSDQLRDALVDIDVLVTAWGTPCLTEEVLQKANRLKLVAHTCGSVANLVSEEMYRRGIRIVCGNEAFARSVAEGTLAYMLCTLRCLPDLIEYMRMQGWKPAVRRGRALTDQTVGIVGFGAISRHLIDMLRPFNVSIKVFSRHMSEEKAAALGLQKASLEEIFSTCKVISLHCARNTENYHLINKELLSMMQDEAVLINTSRGDVIDEAALIEVARDRNIRVMLDVYEVEPLPMNSGLRDLNNVYLMPHCGGPTYDKRSTAARIVLDDIFRFQKGMPLENEVSMSRAATMTH